MRHRLMIAPLLGALWLLALCVGFLVDEQSHSVLAAPEGATATPTNIATATATNTALPSPTLSATPTACTIEFSDVPPGSTFYPYVRCLACRGHIGGYADGTFRPNYDVTRGQLCKIMANIAGYLDPISTDTQSFEDVLPVSTFWLYIENLYLRGIVRGYPCGSAPSEPCIPPQNRPYFRPNTNASRGQVAKVIELTMGFGDPIPPGQQTFEDVTSDNPFHLHVERLWVRNGTTGYPCGGQNEPCIPPQNRPYFRPNNLTTRGQVAKMATLQGTLCSTQLPAGLK
jgi:hypothetical protein